MITTILINIFYNNIFVKIYQGLTNFDEDLTNIVVNSCKKLQTYLRVYYRPWQKKIKCVKQQTSIHSRYLKYLFYVQYK